MLCGERKRRGMARKHGIASLVGLVAALAMMLPAESAVAQPAQPVTDTSEDGVTQVTKTHAPSSGEAAFAPASQGDAEDDDDNEGDYAIAPYSLDEGDNGDDSANGENGSNGLGVNPRESAPSTTVTASADLTGLATVGVTWKQQDMTDASKAPKYRLRTFEHNAWSDWAELPSVDDDTAQIGVTPSYYVGAASKVEAELTPVEGQTITEAKLVTIDSGYSAGNAQGSAYTGRVKAGANAHAAQARSTSVQSTQQSVASAVQTAQDSQARTPEVRQAAAVTSTGTIHTREEWWVNGNPAMTWPPERTGHWKGAIVHHTVDRNNYSQAEVPAMINGIYLYHNLHNQWGDIGYQLIVDRFGGIWEGRDEGVPNQVVPASQVAGAQAYGFNYDTFGVALLGSYHQDVAPTDAQLKSVAAAIAWEFNALGITDPYGTFQYRGTQARITGHGDQSHWSAGTPNRTQCPGQQVWNRMGYIRDLVKGYLHSVLDLPLLSVGNGVFYIDSAKRMQSSGLIENGAQQQGAVLRLGSGTSDAMKFDFYRQPDGSYEIVNAVSNMALDIESGQANDGAVIRQWTRNNTPAQRWWLRVADSGGVYIQSALGNWVLDLSSGNTADGTRIQLHMPNETVAQQFVIASASAKVPANPVQLSQVVNRKLAVGIQGASFDAGAKAQLQTSNGSDSQLFDFARVGNGIYSIKNLNSGLVLEAASGGMQNGTSVRQWSSNGTIAQSWALRDMGNGFVGLANAKSGRVLDVTHGNVSNGTGLQLYELNGTQAQQWLANTVPSNRGILKRIGGDTRYQTASLVAGAGFKKSDWVVIASGESYPDALMASSIAGTLNAPVVLSATDSLDISTVKRIQSLDAKKAVLVGGESVLTPRLAAQVKQLVTNHQIYRFGGSDRYATSADVLRRAPSVLGIHWSKTIIAATGESPYDALSASPIAWKQHAPIVLSRPDGIDTSILPAVKNKSFVKVLIAGGTDVMPAKVERQLRPLATTRLAGKTRYETSTQIVKYAADNGILSVDGAVFATGENYPDALAGGALAGSTGNVLALVNGTDSPSVSLIARKQSKKNKDTAYLLGGINVISQSVADYISATINKRIE